MRILFHGRIVSLASCIPEIVCIQAAEDTSWDRVFLSCMSQFFFLSLGKAVYLQYARGDL